MGLALKMFDTLGLVTIVTHPSMIVPEKISFTLINMEEKEKVPDKQSNKGEVIETLREQVKEISNNSDTEKTYQLAKGAINTAKSVEQLTDFKKNIAIRFAKGKLTHTQKEELETLIVNKKKVLE